MTIDITVKTDPELSWREHSNEGGKLTGLTVRSLAGPCTNLWFIGMRGKQVRGGFTVNTRAFAKLCHKFLAAYVAGGGTFDDLHEEEPPRCSWCKEMLQLTGKHDHDTKKCAWCKADKEKEKP